MSTKKTSRRVRLATRAMTLGVIGLFAYLLLHWMPGGFGWGVGGGGGGAGDARDTNASSKRASSDSETPVSADGRSAPRMVPALQDDDHGDGTDRAGRLASDVSDDEQAALASGTLTVLIDEHTYRLRVPDGQGWRYELTDLNRIRKLAARAVGDANGIRVRIDRRESARAFAEQSLINELQSAGLGQDAIFMSSELQP